VVLRYPAGSPGTTSGVAPTGERTGTYCRMMTSGLGG
jgi:hypothetical protein